VEMGIILETRAYLWGTTSIGAAARPTAAVPSYTK